MIPTITLNNGTPIPQLGFGTLKIPPDRAPTPENARKTADVVRLALQIGYRHIDTAQMYGNEMGVGLALTESGIARDEIYITTKLGNAKHRPDDVRHSFDQSMERLDLDHLDLFLMHWPLPTLYDGDFVSTWQAMVSLIGSGKVRSVGVSNFQPTHLDRIVSATGVVPVVNQIEVHPYFRNDTARAASARHGVAIEAWSPLGQGTVLQDSVIAAIARTSGKSVAQVVLRWHIQHGHTIFPKSNHEERMRENRNIFDFELSTGEMARIDALDRGEVGRIGPNPDTFAWIP